MTTQSGISIAAELKQAWASALSAPDSLRALLVQIVDERCLCTSTLEANATFDDLQALLQDNEPVYVLYRLDDGWLFASYVPNHAKVRQKMLYGARTPFSLHAREYCDS